jgi:hypothetical protein
VAVAENAIREVEPLLPLVSGNVLDRAYLVLFLSYYAKENDPQTCKYGALVLTSGLSDRRKASTRGLLTPLRC